MMARLGSLANVHEVPVKSNMTSLTPFVSGVGGKLNFIDRPRRFYIDDILASDFGHRCLEECWPDGSESHENQSTVAASAAANPGDHSNTADAAIQPNNGTASELDKSTREPARLTTTSMTALPPSSSSVTSSRHFSNNGISTDSSSNSRCSNRRPALKDKKVVVTMEPCNSTGTKVTVKNDTTTVSDVTSSTTSHPISDTKSGWKADIDDSFTLPAWVYCTRYSDRPSAGPRIRRRPAADGSNRRRRRRTAFSVDQLRQLRAEYDHCRYISDDRRRLLADRIGLHVGTVKIWFQNRRASDKKASGVRNELALRLMAEGLYEHHTVTNVTTPTL